MLLLLLLLLQDLVNALPSQLLLISGLIHLLQVLESQDLGRGGESASNIANVLVVQLE